jgi:hypothetical protein
MSYPTCAAYQPPWVQQPLYNNFIPQGLIDLVCTQEADVEGCANFVMGYWESIARGLFGDAETVPKICGYLGYCKKNMNKITCADCERGLNEIAVLFQENDALAMEVHDDLQGHIFCENPSEEILKPEGCKELVELYANKAIKALGTLLKASAPKICADNGCTRK